MPDRAELVAMCQKAIAKGAWAELSPVDCADLLRELQPPDPPATGPVVVGLCKECEGVVTTADEIDGRKVYDCPTCGHPNGVDELFEPPPEPDETSPGVARAMDRFHDELKRVKGEPPAMGSECKHERSDLVRVGGDSVRFCRDCGRELVFGVTTSKPTPPASPDAAAARELADECERIEARWGNTDCKQPEERQTMYELFDKVPDVAATLRTLAAENETLRTKYLDAMAILSEWNNLDKASAIAERNDAIKDRDRLAAELERVREAIGPFVKWLTTLDKNCHDHERLDITWDSYGNCVSDPDSPTIGELRILAALAPARAAAVEGGTA